MACLACSLRQQPLHLVRVPGWHSDEILYMVFRTIFTYLLGFEKTFEGSSKVIVPKLKLMNLTKI